MTNKELSNQILNLIGGKANISEAWHCMTRLRFRLVDTSKADIDGLKKIKGVLNAQFQGEQFQVIVGNNAANVYTEIKQEIGELNATTSNKSGEKTNAINVVFDTISGIFNPILPAITGAGLLKGVLSLLTFLSLVSADSSEYFILNMISDAAFYFLPFLIAFSAAKKFKTNEFVAASLAGILMYPSFAALAGNAEVGPLRFFFINIPVADYNSTVLPIILGVLVLSFVYRFFDKYIPKAVRMIFAPVLSLIITAPIMLFILAPIGSYIGNYLAIFLGWLFDVAGPIAGLVVAGFMPFIVMTGMHYSLFPVALDSMARVGYDIILLPMSLVNNLAQCAATLAVAFKTKDKEMRPVAFSCALSALFGVTEPAMYGVTLKLKKPLYAAMIGSGIGGIIYGTFVVKATAFSIPGITAVPAYLSNEYPSNFMWCVVGILASFVVSFILTMLFKFDESADPVKDSSDSIHPHVNLNGGFKVQSPLDGKTIPLSQVEDDVFAGEVLGKGIGIIPSGSIIRSPFDGKVSMITDTSHAIGILSNDGIELLIHVGINTVSLNGNGFKTLVQNDETIVSGQELLHFNQDIIHQNQLSSTTAVIVTNTDMFKNIASNVGVDAKTCQTDILMVES